MTSLQLIRLSTNADRLRGMVETRVFVASVVVFLVFTLVVPAFLGWDRINIWYVLFWTYAMLFPPNPHRDTASELKRLSEYAMTASGFAEEMRLESLATVQQRWDSCLRSVWAFGLDRYFT